jgi:hypothetical protein
LNDINRFMALNKHVKQVISIRCSFLLSILENTFKFFLFCLQIELSYLTKEKISSFYKQPNDLNEIICEIHIVIDFVILTGSRDDMKIMDYAGNVLKMSIDETCVNKHVNKIFLYLCENVLSITFNVHVIKD